MEDVSKIYESLYDFSDADAARNELIMYVKSEVQHFAHLSDQTYTSAYRLTGLMATDYVRTLSDDDPIVDVLSLAGELEVAPPNSQELASEIAQKISSL